MADWIIVGAGFTGAVLADRLARGCDQRVLVVDQRDHIGGNAYDYADERGFIVHKYGPHIFHTNSQKVWAHLSQYTDWRPYYHRVLGMVDGQAVPIPFNLNSLAALFPSYMAENLSRRLIETFGYGVKVPILKLKTTEDAELKFLAEFIYAKVFEGYNRKQWGLTPEALDPGVTARVPIHISRDDRYFQDVYQAMPLEGYSRMFERMLTHPNIRISLSTEFAHVRDSFPKARIVYTGAIDGYFDNAHGALPYRSLRFVHRHETLDQVQAVGQVNYPNEFDFTRITEFKHLTGQICTGTVRVEEYPEAYEPGINEPYYPIPTPETALRLKPYLDMAKDLRGKVWFAGRLGDYAYYNMDQACARALSLFEKTLVPAIRGDASEPEVLAESGTLRHIA